MSTRQDYQQPTGWGAAVTLLPALMGIAGTMLTVAGALIAISRRRHSFIGLGVVLILARLTVTAPVSMGHTVRTAVITSLSGLTGLTGIGRDWPEGLPR